MRGERFEAPPPTGQFQKEGGGMRSSIDIALIGGWHVTVFHPWALALTALAILLALAIGASVFLIRAA